LRKLRQSRGGLLGASGETFLKLRDRRPSRGTDLSGGEEQMLATKAIPGPRDTDPHASRVCEGSADQNSGRGGRSPGKRGHGLHAEGETRRRERPRGLFELPRDQAIELERLRRHNVHYDRARLSLSGRHRTCSSPQVLSALSTGTSAFPFLVSRYSARGGCSE
jgi:hypothetical protein